MRIETIVQNLKNGNIKALKLIYELYYESAFKAAFFIAKDHGLAEDAVHEAFIKLRNKIEQLEDPSKLETWLSRMAVNVARDIVRQRSKSTLLEETRDIYMDNQLISPEKVLLENERKQDIKRLISCLQADHKRIIYLRYYENLSINEMSTTLNIPIGTVKSRLIRARGEIRKLLDPDSRNIRHKIYRLPNPKEVK